MRSRTSCAARQTSDRLRGETTMEQMQQKEEGSLKVQTIPQKELEQACFHALGLITRNC